MNKKEKIISSALDLFAKHGFTETSIDKIAKHAKVSKGLTYTHFKNKDDLLRAVIQSTITQMTDEMMQANEPTIKSLLMNLLNELIANKQTIRLCLLLVVHPQTPSSITKMLEDQKNELLDLLSLLLKEKFKDDSKIEAELLLATIDGITLDYVTNVSQGSLESKINYIIERYTV